MAYPKSWDLLAASLVAVLTAGLALAGITNPVLGLLMITLVPGYALVQAAFVGRSFSLIEKAMLSLGLSLVLTVLGGLLLNQTSWGLQPGSWAAWVGGLTLVACGVALLRREQPFLLGSSFSPRRFSFGFSGGQMLMVSLATIMVVGAVIVARNGAEEIHTTVTQFWLLPASSTNSDSLKLGITSTEIVPVDYRLELKAGDKVIQEWPTLKLEPNANWVNTINLPTDLGQGQKIDAFLYRLDAPNKIYRQTTFWTGQPVETSGK